ncbi:MAG: phosphoglucosamine mutase [Deltaproteobacteria bacterium]|nr:phosphoglucosamine mutase [Deltaproteobacteria bacterium]
MGRLFGTDGIRGKANQDPITPEMATKIGRAVVSYCKKRGLSPCTVVGRDTRASGRMLESGFLSGALSEGGSVFALGEIPAPAVAYFTGELSGSTGLVISASHNPHDYNGFKFFGGAGFKLSEADEGEMEALILEEDKSQGIWEIGKVVRVEAVTERYAEFLVRSLPRGSLFNRIRIVIDCANGATYRAAPVLFDRLGLTFEVLFGEPDGKNINLDCGSQHPDTLRARVLDSGADAGFAFDGDGDRLVAVDEKGHVLTGDQLLGIFAKMLKEREGLRNNLVVCTVMSNLGLRYALEREGISQVITDVGDRNVMQAMLDRNANLGGEGSGHIIFHDYHTTGDGLLSAIQLLRSMLLFDRPLSELATWVTLFPQVIKNVPVNRKPELLSVPEIVKTIEGVESSLGDRGRVLVRYSGTEPVCRVMVEGEQEKEVEACAEEIADTVRKELN